MDRRAFLGILAVSVFVSTGKSAAQNASRLPSIGILHTAAAPTSQSANAIVNGLRDLGYVDGKTATIILRAAHGEPDRLPRLAAELMERKVDVIYAVGPAAVRTALEVAAGIPIVALDLETDPVQAGWARSLAQPGGDVTGLFLDLPDLAGKWLALLREAAPGLRRIGVLWDTTTGTSQLLPLRAEAQRRAVDLVVLEFHDFEDLAAALRAGADAGIKGMVLLSSPTTDLHSPSIAAFTVKNRLPAISPFRQFARNGGLMAYGPDLAALYNRAATYADRILKGAKAGDLPIEQPTKFNMWVNLRTAKVLGLAIPQSLMLAADEVIQ
jgi:putative ABC transport system substrate-binding protein